MSNAQSVTTSNVVPDIAGENYCLNAGIRIMLELNKLVRADKELVNMSKYTVSDGKCCSPGHC